MGKNKFEDFLNEEDVVVAIDWDEKKEFFLEKIEEFYNQLDSFLKPYNDKISVENVDYGINEERLGNYTVIKRILTIKGKKVTFTPIGTILIGAWGRIDMEGENGTVKFVLVPEYSGNPKIETALILNDEDRRNFEEKQRKEDVEIKKAKKIWKISTPPPHIHYIDLNDETFFDVLMEIIDG